MHIILKGYHSNFSQLFKNHFTLQIPALIRVYLLKYVTSYFRLLSMHTLYFGHIHLLTLLSLTASKYNTHYQTPQTVLSSFFIDPANPINVTHPLEVGQWRKGRILKQNGLSFPKKQSEVNNSQLGVKSIEYAHTPCLNVTDLIPVGASRSSEWLKFWVNLCFDMGTAMPTLQSLRSMGNGQRVWPHGSGSREMLQFSSGSPNSHIYEGWITVCSFLLRIVYSLKLLTYRNLLRSLANHLLSARLDKNAEVLGCKGSLYCLAPDLLMCECCCVPRTKMWRVTFFYSDIGSCEIDHPQEIPVVHPTTTVWIHESGPSPIYTNSVEGYYDIFGHFLLVS